MNTNIIFCFYSLEYDSDFIQSWIKLVTHLIKNKIKFTLTTGDSCNAFYAKQMCLGGSVLEGSFQKPYQGKLKYEYIVFINNNIKFEVNDFIKLYNRCVKEKLPFLSANIKDRYYTQKKVDKDLLSVNRVEFDMVIIKKGIFEQLEYPWFRPHISKDNDEMDLIDVDICNRLKKEIGLDLLVDTNIKIRRKKEYYE